MKPESRIAQIIDQEICEHVYGITDDGGYLMLPHDLCGDYQKETTHFSNYCMECGKRLVE